MLTPFDIALPEIATLAQEAAPPIAGPGGAPAGQPVAPGTGPAGQPSGGQPAAPAFGGGFIWFILIMFLFLIGMQMFAGRKERRKRAEMLASIGRHDRIQTAGGLIGTVSEVRDNEIVLKVDESTNTKVRIARSAIAQVLKKAGQPAAEDTAPEPEKVAS
ncbi:MAG: preprotein translocase subunit YajC [Planctomycetota bacterium]|nr:MAG: preprotein translocase subunit YajC [Planctomycetota bacterium]